MKFLIGYDIAGNRVLSRVAKYLEGKAYRIQYSVFLFEGTERTLIGRLISKNT